MELKLKKLQKMLQRYAESDFCVAFSGGVDSALLLILACEAAEKTGKTVYALTMDTILHPKADLKIARETAAMTNARHIILTLDELAVPEIRNNPVNRCYLCKKELYSRMFQFAKEKGISVLLDGSNADDLHVYRPGLQAIRELGAKTPLAECGLTKREIRRIAGLCHLPVAERPSTPCLATRLPYGTKIDLKILRKIGEAEELLRSAGYRNVRVRVHGDLVRLEVDTEDFDRILAEYERIVQSLKTMGFAYITLDMEGFRS